MDDLTEVVEELDIRIGIVAVPGVYAQKVIERLVDCGVSAIMNYAPITPQSRDGVKIRNIDPILSLQTMTYYLLAERQ